MYRRTALVITALVGSLLGGAPGEGSAPQGGAPSAASAAAAPCPAGAPCQVGAPGQAEAAAPEQASGPAAAPPEAGAAASGEAALLPLPAPGGSAQRRLDAGGVDRYAVPASPGTYLRVVLWEQGSDVSLRLLAASGAIVTTTENPGQRPGAMILDALLDEGGEHTLEVTRLTTITKADRYRLRVEALRPATAEDRAGAPARERAQALLTEALTLKQEDQEEKTREAIERCKEALPLWREGSVPFGEAWTEHALGTLYNMLSDREGAETAFRSAFHVWDEVPDPIGWAWSAVAWADQYEGAPLEELQAVLEKSVATFAGDGDPPAEASALNNLACVFRELGRREAALRKFQEALGTAEDQGDAYQEAEVLVNLGLSEWSAGNLRASLKYFTRAGSLLRPEAEGSQLLAKALVAQAVIFRRLGELQRSLDLYAAARPLVLRSGNQDLEATLLQNLGSLYLHLGEARQAADVYAEALDVCRQAEDRTCEVMTLGYLGWAHYVNGDTDGALRLLAESLQLSAGVAGELAVRSRMFALSSRGAVRASLGRTAEGLHDLSAALEIARDLGDRRAQAPCESLIGQALLDSGDVGGALETLTRARDLSVEVGDESFLAVTLRDLARVAERQGDLNRAADSLEQALEVLESQRRTLLSDDFRASIFVAARSAYESYVDVLLRLNSQEPHAGFDAAAFEASERARARGLSELLAEARVDLRKGIDPALRGREEALADEVTEVQQRILKLASKGDPDRDALELQRGRLQQLREDQGALEVEIRRRAPRYAEVAYPEPLSLGEIQSLLDEETVLLEYMLGTENAYLFAVTRDSLTTFVLPVSSQEIAREVSRLRESLEQGSPFGDLPYVRTAFDLFQVLVGPATSIVAGKTHLLVSPDGKLYNLPFEVLLTSPVSAGKVDFRALHYLIRDVAVSYVPSARVLADLKGGMSRPPHSGLDFVAFADPVYERAGESTTAATRPASPTPVLKGSEGTGSPPFRRLVGSGQEVEGIAALFPPGSVEVNLRSRASETVVKTDPAVRTAQWLHFATHGIVDEQEPANTGLVLSLDERAEDGFLQLREIFGLELSARLVVLSACDTGRGKELRGEGLVGLSRAFLYAGASSLVASLWEVDDEASSDLMLQFYRGLVKDGLAESEALQRAKVWMLSREGTGSHPRIWAPFVLLGRWQ
jgi:CHAT domain-containing protein